MMKIVFLDKDGTLVRNLPYNVDPNAIELMPGVIEGLSWLHQAGFGLVVISNQSGVARGLFTESDLVPVWDRLRELLGENGIPLMDVFYCPHHPDGSNPAYTKECDCRKPAPGLLYQAANKYLLNLGQCWMVGDILDDVAAGNQAGCRTVLIDSPNETEWILGPGRLPTYIAESFEDTANYIVSQGDRNPADLEALRWN
jgi:D,D-heptose 1,7-bisphosphate phosphatase